MTACESAPFPTPITGYVVDINGVGVAGAAVSIFDAGGNVVATATTDITGFYFFATVSVLNQGVNYTVAVTGLPPGFVNTPPPVTRIHVVRERSHRNRL